MSADWTIPSNPIWNWCSAYGAGKKSLCSQLLQPLTCVTVGQAVRHLPIYARIKRPNVASLCRVSVYCWGYRVWRHSVYIQLWHWPKLFIVQMSSFIFLFYTICIVKKQQSVHACSTFCRAFDEHWRRLQSGKSIQGDLFSGDIAYIYLYEYIKKWKHPTSSLSLSLSRSPSPYTQTFCINFQNNDTRSICDIKLVIFYCWSSQNWHGSFMRFTKNLWSYII